MSKVFIIISLLTLIFTHAFSQECVNFLPLNKGKGAQYQIFNSRNNLTGTVEFSIDSIANAAGVIFAYVNCKNLDKKGEEIAEWIYEYKCAAGELILDPVFMIGPDILEQYKDKDIETERSGLYLPSSLQLGQRLEDGGCLMKIFETNQKLADLDLRCSGRKVVAMDTVTSPAGIFPCYKIATTTVLTVTTLFLSYTVEMTVNEYFAENIGWVKSENYNTRGKLLGYSLLSRLY